MGFVVFAARLFVGVLLLLSGAGKLANRSEFLQIVEAYGLLPKRALTPEQLAEFRTLLAQNLSQGR